MISGRWEHPVLFVSREGKAHIGIFYFLECKERKTEGYWRETAFFFFLKKHYLFIFMRMYVGGNGDAHACLKTEKGI